MIRIGILGDIGSGKSYIAKNFGYPVFNADEEVVKLYKRNKRIFLKLKKVLPKFIYSFPVNKKEIINAIFENKINLKKISKIIHSEIRKEMNKFLKKHVNKKIVILDIPLLLENKIDKKGDILVFVKSNKKAILKRLKKRPGFNYKLFINFKKIQLPLDYKMKKSHFIIRNNFTNKFFKRDIKYILKRIL
ncbi:dephospho-CoA kinase [Candidatus Pelagibacter sp.]|nr:dephospho-CoA kinase [Candidatus Pelagibacter sp.]